MAVEPCETCGVMIDWDIIKNSTDETHPNDQLGKWERKYTAECPVCDEELWWYE